MRGMIPLFRSDSLFMLAMTHKSHSRPNNERLETLGDSVLGLIVTDYLYQRWPHDTEGQLCRLRTEYVSGSVLFDVAVTIGLSGHLRLGQGELASGGRFKQSILENALEALIGAIYLDQGYNAARDFVLREVVRWVDDKR